RLGGRAASRSGAATEAARPRPGDDQPVSDQEPVHAEGAQELTMRIQVEPGARFAGVVACDGVRQPRRFDGWVEFMGAVAELRGEREGGRPDSDDS
ncbi:MAG: hypothetical protein ACYDCB_09755, partial [Candidatus Dormibacteria bacterium]